MKFAKLILFMLLGSQVAKAQQKSLTLEEYLSQVKTQSPEVRGLIQEVTANELRFRQADLDIIPGQLILYEIESLKHEHERICCRR